MKFLKRLMALILAINMAFSGTLPVFALELEEVGEETELFEEEALDESIVLSDEEPEENLWEGKSAVFVGDSITAGVGTTKLYYEYLDEALGFGSVIGMGVGGSCMSTASDYGTTKEPLINRYNKIPSADLIVVFMGTNDYGHETPLGTIDDNKDGTFYGALNVIIPDLVAKHTSSKIVFVTSLHRYGAGTSKILGTKFTYDNIPNGVGATLEDYVNAIKTVCNKNDVSVIDLFTECTLDPSIEEVRAQYMPDGIHPNAAGHEVFAKIIEEHIREYEPVKVDPEDLTEIIHGNKFTSGSASWNTNRASSRINYYLKAGTVITFKEMETMQWACSKTDGEISVNGLGYFPEKQWTDIATATVEADGWVGFTFKYRDETKSFDLSRTLSDFITIEEPKEKLTPDFSGKKVSILSHSASTYVGVSNNTADNSTIGKNDVYYTEGRHGVYRKDTWWQQAADALGMEVLVNNSWSGSCIFQPRKGAASVCYDTRAVNLHNDHTGEEPDVIWVYIGGNDFAYYKDTFGKASDVDYSALIKENGDGTFSYAEPNDTCEAYAITLHKIQNRYPDAGIYCMTSTARRETDYTGDNYPDAGQPTEYCAELWQIAEDFGFPVVDLEKAIPKDVELFDKYMGDKRAHPNALGMDQITNEVLSVMLGEESEIRHVISKDGTANEQAVILGGSYNAEIELPEGYTLSVKMSGEDITDEVYSGGKIFIEEVTGDIEITAERGLQNFRWELKDDVFDSVSGKEFTENELTLLEGSISDGIFSGVKYSLADEIYLNHDKPWVMEWAVTGNWDATLFAKSPTSGIKDAEFIFRSSTDYELFAIGAHDGTQYNNYGIAQKDLGIDMTKRHVYRLENRIAENGSNMVCLLIDGKEIGPMNRHFIGSKKDTGNTSDWVSGKDFSFGYMGTVVRAINYCSLEYIEVWENGEGTEPVWEQGTITAATGIERDYPNVVRNKGYLKLSDYSGITIDAGHYLTYFVYDKDYNYLGNGKADLTANFLLSGEGISTGEMLIRYPEGVYFRIALWRGKDGEMTVDMIPDSGISFYDAEHGPVIWEMGSIYAKNGITFVREQVIRCISYLPVEDYVGVGIGKGYAVGYLAYDENLNYLGNGNPDKTGYFVTNGFYTKDIIENYPGTKYIKLIFREDPIADFTMDAVQTSGIRVYKIGEDFELPEPELKATNIMTMNRCQDGAVYDKKVFLFNNSGNCNVYDIETKAKIGNFTVDKVSVLNPHANSVCFGNEFYEEGDKYPLLYVNIYNNYWEGYADKKEGTCCVYRITEENGVFESKLVQVIKIGFTDDYDLWNSAEDNGYPYYLPYGNFVVDTDENKLWAFVLRNGEEQTRFFSFDLPKIGDGVYNETYGCNLVTLESADIIEMFDIEHLVVIQGCCYYGGKVLSVSGIGKGSSILPYLQVIDPEKGEIEKNLCFEEIGITNEPEMISVDPMGGTIYYASVDGILRKLEINTEFAVPELEVKQLVDGFDAVSSIKTGDSCLADAFNTVSPLVFENLKLFENNAITALNLFVTGTVVDNDDTDKNDTEIDDDEEYTFDISVIDSSSVKTGGKYSVKKTYTLKVKGSEIKKNNWNTFDVSDLGIVVEEGETLGFGSGSSTLEIFYINKNISSKLSYFGHKNTTEDTTLSLRTNFNLPIGVEGYSTKEPEIEDPKALKGKTISILGASISTYAGTSNGTAADTTNSTIRNNAKYYPNNTVKDVALNDTWWMQFADDLGLRLLVNNSWSGGAILLERAGTVGAYVDRCVQLHDNTGENAGEDPDIIIIQKGFNDFSYGKSTLGTAEDIDYDTLILENGYAVPKTTMEATVIMLDKMTKRYPDAEIYMFSHFRRVNQSAADTKLMEKLNDSIKTVCERYGVKVIDLYSVLGSVEFVGDGSLHPNRLGMDIMTEAAKRTVFANTSYEAETHLISFELDGVSADYGDNKIVLSGDSFIVNLTAEIAGILEVSVIMDGKDITETAYKDGKVEIAAVTGDVSIKAKSFHEPKDYRWEFDGANLVCVKGENALTKISGTTTDGVFDKAAYSLENPVVLMHDKPWAVEWKSEGTFMNTNGSTGARIFTSDNINANYNARYIFKSATKWLIAMGEKTSSGSHNYGIALEDYGIDGSALHTYRFENRIASDGSNMVYLFVDGKEIGALNNYYVGTTDKGTTSDWLSGKDFVLPYMGTDTHGFSNAKIDYIAVWENGHEHTYKGAVCSDCGIEHPNAANYKGKVFSVLGDSISTFAGYIPKADGFNLEHLARYPQDNLLTDVNETWWMQVIAELGGKIGINDSWRGSTVSGYPSVTTGVAGYLAAMSNITQIQNLGSNGTPDVIMFYGGTNDFAHTPNLGSFDPKNAPTEVDLETLKWDNLADAYCHALLRLEYYYPDTEIIAMLPTYTKSYYSNDKLAQGNALLKEICEHYGVKYIDLRDCGISVADLPDGIHPDAKGMDYITDAVIGILLDECETKVGENVVYSVTHNLKNAKAEKHYYKGASAGKAFIETISGENLSVSVTMGGKDITAEVYEDGKIIIASVNGDIIINAKGEKEPVYAEYIQDLPEDYYGKNLWKIFEHYEEYYTVSGWGIHSSGAVRSVTFEVKEGEKIYASSFEKAGINGTTATDGIRITFFNEDDVLVSMSADAVYKEFAEKGYITVPKNAKAVNIPMWTDSLDWELYVYDSFYEPEFSLGEHLEDLPEKFCAGTNLWTALEPENKYYTGSAWGNISGNSVYSLTISVEENVRIFATSFGKSGENGGSRNGIRITWFGEDGVIESVGPDEVYAEFTVNGYITVPEGTTAVNVPMWNGNDSNELYILSAEHNYKGASCSVCGTEHPNAANYEDKIISVLSASTSTFAGYIPTADGFNLEHRARYPQDNLLTDVNETWWMQVINELDAKLGINESWAGSQVLNTQDNNSGDLGPDAAMASITRINNIGANGTPDVIFFFGAGNDMGRGVALGSFDPATAPKKVDLVTNKWESLADAYVAAIMRLKYFYPDSEIVVMTTYAMPSYVTEAKLNKYAPVLNAICDHYGVKYVDLRNAGVTFDMLPDKIHPNAEGMDRITEAVLDFVLNEYEIEPGENKVYSVTHELTNAEAEKHYYKGVSAGKPFEEAISGENLSVKVTMGGKDITVEVYEDGKISISSVTGDIVVTAKGKFNCDGHLQELPEELCAGTNLWTALEPENIYYLGTKWGLYENAPDVHSITFPVNEGERIFATSFGAYPSNGSTANGTRITWFSENGVLESVARDVVYKEFAANGFITVPKGAVAVNIPHGSNNSEFEVYLLDREHDCGSVVTAPTCTEQGYTTYTCSDCGESYVDDYVEATGHSFGDWYETEAPTFVKEGEERRDCANCEHYETRTVEKKDGTYGDVNEDGEIDVMDANIVRRYAVKLVDLSEKQMEAADVSGDGKVNVIDANLIRRYVAKLLSEFPVEG